jgi:hypothetical protein
MWIKRLQGAVITAAATLILASAGCSHSVAIALPPQKLVVLVYDQGHVAQRCAIRPGTDKFQKLSRLLAQSSDGWHHRLSSYVPTLLVMGADISLNFRDDSVVMNYKGGEYARSISKDSYGFLSCKAT